MNLTINITADFLNIVNTIAIIIGTIIAICTMIKGIVEYHSSNKLKRMEFYENYRKKLKENESFKKIISCLDNKDEKIRKIPRIERYYFLGFYEDIAILEKNNLIKLDLAYYMFGYYAIRCEENKYFWDWINKDSLYWKIFIEFAEKMGKQEKMSNKKLKLKI